MSTSTINLSTRERPPWTPANRGMVSPKNVYPIHQRSPFIDPPDASWPFIPNGVAEMPAEGASATICSITAPLNRAGVIWRIANGTGLGSGIAGWNNGDGTLIWQILRNNQPVQYFNNILTIVGLVELGGAELVAPIRVNPGDNIALIVKNLAVAPTGQVLIGLLSGFLFPQNQQPQASR